MPCYLQIISIKYIANELLASDVKQMHVLADSWVSKKHLYFIATSAFLKGRSGRRRYIMMRKMIISE